MPLYKVIPLKKESVDSGDVVMQIGMSALASLAPSTANVATNLTVLEAGFVTNHTTQTSALKMSQQPASGVITVTGPNTVTDAFSYVFIGRIQ